MLKTILGIVVLAIAGVLIYAATKPDTFRVERSTLIKAPPEKIFPLINDIHEMQQWSAWEKVDPAMQRTHSGAPSGVGAIYEWKGNKEIGSGRMEITESVPPSRVVIKMDFIEPFPAHNTAAFTLKPEADGNTRVTNAIFGPMPYISKVMSTFFSMDRMIGDKFEQSLAALKALAER